MLNYDVCQNKTIVITCQQKIEQYENQIKKKQKAWYRPSPPKGWPLPPTPRTSQRSQGSLPQGHRQGHDVNVGQGHGVNVGQGRAGRWVASSLRWR